MSISYFLYASLETRCFYHFSFFFCGQTEAVRGGGLFASITEIDVERVCSHIVKKKIIVPAAGQRERELFEDFCVYDDPLQYPLRLRDDDDAAEALA